MDTLPCVYILTPPHSTLFVNKMVVFTIPSSSFYVSERVFHPEIEHGGTSIARTCIARYDRLWTHFHVYISSHLWDQINIIDKDQGRNEVTFDEHSRRRCPKKPKRISENYSQTRKIHCKVVDKQNQEHQFLPSHNAM